MIITGDVKLQASWDIAPVKHVFSVLNGSTPSSSERSYWDGAIYWATPEDIGSLDGRFLFDTKRKITQDGYNNSGTHIAPIGSVVLTTRAPVGNLAIAGVPLCTNQGCKTLVPRITGVDTIYFYYQLLARKDDLSALSTGTTFQELSTSALESLDLWFPPITTQRAIAAFLDRETAKIDAMIDAKQRLLDLLAEKRRALITHAVTRGLDPDAPLRDSGVPWIGKVPAHWEVTQLKLVCQSLQIGPFGSQLHAEDYVDNGTPIINPVHMINGKIIPDMQVTVDKSTSKRLAHHRLKVGDVIFARRGEIGRCALVTEQEQGWICGSGSLRARPNPNILYPEYLFFCVSNTSAGSWLSLMSVGTTMENLNTEIIGGLPLPLPPLLEQVHICRNIFSVLTHLDELHFTTNKTINFLQERRAALIAAAVTGQIDIAG